MREDAAASLAAPPAAWTGQERREMATIAPERPETLIRPGYRGFLAFCDLLGFELQPYMRRIARAAFGDARELVVCIPKGNFKTTMCSLLGLHHLLVTDDAEVRIGAGVRSQAEVCLKRIKGFARHEAIRDRLTITHFELRDEFGGDLTVLAGEGERLHGTSPSERHERRRRPDPEDRAHARGGERRARHEPG